MSFIEKLSLFPYASFWRISGRAQLKNKFGGIVSLLLIVAFVAIAFSKMIEIFKMTTIFTSQQTFKSPLPQFVNLTTSYTDPQKDQFMFAIRPLSNGQQNNLAITDFDLSLIHKTLIFDSITKNYSMSFTDDVLEKCTLSHFYKLYSQNIQVKNWESLDLWCLPINRTYEIGGSQMANFKQLIINATCKTANCKYKKFFRKHQFSIVFFRIFYFEVNFDKYLLAIISNRNHLSQTIKSDNRVLQYNDQYLIYLLLTTKYYFSWRSF